MRSPRRIIFRLSAVLGVLALALAAAAYAWSLGARAPANPAWHGRTMGTLYTVKLAGSEWNGFRLRRLQWDVELALRDVNREMSHYQPDSELFRFNLHSSPAPFRVSAPLAEVLRFSLDLHRHSGGAFDPTLGALINLWGFGPAGPPTAIPTTADVARAQALCGAGHLAVSPQNEIQKDLPGLQINLGAVAKGYGVDQAARVLAAAGVSNFMVEIGGEIVARGRNADGEPWRIGIDCPAPGLLPGEQLARQLRVSDLAVATSGDYRNFIEDAAGRVFCHILDPATGFPVTHALASVTVIAANGMIADALATTLFVLGPERGLKWIRTFPGAEALFLVRETNGSFRALASPGFRERTGCEPPP